MVCNHQETRRPACHAAGLEMTSHERVKKHAARVPKARVDKFAERRAELGEAALTTLATLGYARTSLREIAQNSEFSHGVLHYYFSDKVDLIICSVKQYKARCVTRYDHAVDSATTYDELMEGFLQSLGDTLRDEGHVHRLWYDLRSQALFEKAFHDDVVHIDKSLEDMIWRIMSRFAALSGEQSGPAAFGHLRAVRWPLPAGAAQAPVGRCEGHRGDAGGGAALHLAAVCRHHTGTCIQGRCAQAQGVNPRAPTPFSACRPALPAACLPTGRWCTGRESHR
jgi:AcrR family transcriptional regulator